MRAAAVTLIAALGVALPPAAAGSSGPGEPANEIVRTDDRWRVPIGMLDATGVRLTGHVDRHELAVPVPAGTTPLSLDGAVLVSPDVVGGFIEVRGADGAVLGTVELGTSGDERRPPGRPFSVPLGAADVVDGTAPLTLLSMLDTGDGQCEVGTVGAHADLLEAAVTVTGATRPPDTVGEFFPPLLSHLHLQADLDGDGSDALVAESVLRLTSSAVARSVAAPPVVSFGGVGTPVDGDDAPFDRVVVIDPDAEGVSVGLTTTAVPQLTIGGSGDDIARATRMLASELAPLGVDSEVAVVDIADSAVSDGRERHTFNALGISDLQATGVGQLSLRPHFSQTDLGGPVGGLVVHLAGNHTPAVDGIRATLEVLVNGVLVHTEPLGAKGRFGVELAVDDRLLRRDNDLEVRVHHTPATGECRPGVHPFVLQLDPSSTIEVTAGQTLPSGFGRFPQVLADGFVVGFDTLDETRVRAAVSLLTALQAMATDPLDARVVDVESAVSAGEPAVIVAGAGSAGLDDLDLPFRPDDLRASGSGGRALTLDLDADFGVLQAFAHGGHDVLTLTARRDAARLSEAAEMVVAHPSGWSALTGDVYVVPASGAPASLHLRTDPVTARPVVSASGSWWDDVRPYVLGALAVLIVVFLAWAYPRVVHEADD